MAEKLQSIIGEPGQVTVERVPMLPKPIAHQEACNYVAHQIECTVRPVDGFCNCLDQCTCGSMTEQEINDWLNVLRPSRVAIAAQAAQSRSRKGKDFDTSF